MKYLGVDFGLRRVGLATSDGELAAPLKVIEGSNFSDLLDKIKKEAKGFDKVVVGLPEGKMGKIVTRVIKALKQAGCDVVAADETLSTQRASRQTIELNIPKKKRRISDDYSAALILQEYLDTR